MPAFFFHAVAAFLLLAIITIAATPLAAAQDAGASDPFYEQAKTLVDASLKDRRGIVEQLAASDDPRLIPLLRHLLEGDLYYSKEDGELLVVDGDTDAVTSWLTDEAVEIGKSDRKKITTNNQLRGLLRDLIARLQLTNDDATVRYNAVRQLLGEEDDDTTETIRELIASEDDRETRELMQVVLDFERLSKEEQVEDDLFQRLSRRLEPEVKNKLTAYAESASPAMASNAADALEKIDARVRFYGHIETIFFGLSLGSVLVLAAIGLAITFGVMGVINMAHGELIMLGAYTTWVIQQWMPSNVGAALLLSIPAAFLVAGFVGVLIERLVIRYLYGRPLETLLATFGISLILQQAVRTIFSPLNRSVVSPSWMSGTLEINSVLALTNNRLVIIGFCLAVFALLSLVMQRTRLGLEVRAVSQNRPMARAMGIRSERVDMLTFGLGSGVAGIAGVALSQLTNVGPNLGQGYIIDSFMVVVFGGVGNLWGTLVSGFTLGIANKFLEPWSGSVLAKILILVFIILFIQKRPRGLFPQKGRAVEA